MQCKKILVVEDDARLRQMIEKVFDLSNIEVEIAGNGKEALDYLKENMPPALILLDLMMPVMSGPEFVARLNEEGRLTDIPIVLMSALPIEKAHNPYDLPVLMKPLRLQTLVDLGNKYCR